MSRRITTDFLVIGSGLAGLNFARKASELGDVVIVTKDLASKGSTQLAQGGMAAVIADKSIQSHIDDTFRAGAGLCKLEIIEKTVKAGKPAAKELIEIGVPFDRDPDDSTKLYFTREGGHSERRVLHVADTTGKSLEDVSLDLVKNTKAIKLLENFFAIDLLTQHNVPGYVFSPDDPIECYGAYIYDENNKQVITVLAQYTIIATGGTGQVYLHTTNPDVATGDGIAMGYRAGTRVANMEFIQFHPTTLYDPDNTKESFLISEAVRGEGAILCTEDGYRFMKDYDEERLELAPRDIVARAIDDILKKTGTPCVFLDISHKDPEWIKNRFPNIYNTCLKRGHDITKDKIPVVPAAHYVCGGILTDDTGKTDIKYLYAIGETSYTGLHGANRLASNSLLEAAVFAHFAYKDIRDNGFERKQFPSLPDWQDPEHFNDDEWVIVSHNLQEIRKLMWDYVGIVRSDMRLMRALEKLNLIFNEVNDFYQKNPIRSDVLELRNLCYVSWLVVRSALSRTESRGLHYNIDHPGTLPGVPSDTIFRSSRFGQDQHINMELDNEAR